MIVVVYIKGITAKFKTNTIIYSTAISVFTQHSHEFLLQSHILILRRRHPFYIDFSHTLQALIIEHQPFQNGLQGQT